jgi:vacuolar protein sorting-associated protein 41
LRLRFDCIVSGVSLYTPNLLLVLAYITPDENESQKDVKADSTPRRGITRRQNALQPEMRIVDINTKEEVCADTLNVSRFESLTATDYHLGILPVIRASTKTTTHRGALEVLGNFGSSIWDASMYSTKLLSSAAVDATLYSAQLFASGASVRSAGSGNKPSKGANLKDSDTSLIPSKPVLGPNPALLTRSMKIFIQSPYDCVLAIKPTRSDHVAWLVEHEKYEEAWNEIDLHPDAIGGIPDPTPTTSTPSTPTRTQGSTTLYDFFDDSASSVTKKPNFYSQSEKEKRRIGDKWLQQLVNAQEWAKAGQVCGKVIGTSHNWEHWVSVFADANKHTEIAYQIPTEPIRPPLSSWVYEIMLGNYISKDRPKLAEFLDRWSPDLFDVGSVVSAMESRLRTGEVSPDTTEGGIRGRDWRILTDGLAKLYLASGRTRDALKCYIRLQDADVALALIRENHLVDAVADDIPGLLLLRITKEQQKEGSLSELEELSIEPIRLLVSEAHHGVVSPGDVVEQLKQQKSLQPFLFFYFRALWNGDTAEDPSTKKRTVRDATTHRLTVEGKSLVNDFADTALKLFAEYDRSLLFEFLKASPSYNLSLASSICEERGYIPEFVYILSKEGNTKKALYIIIEQLNDVSQAITFAKEQDDPDLWDDLLSYSMNKPTFIRALLEEAGTAIDPIALIRKIPDGLEIMGLRDSLTRMVKEYELQHSIGEGVARVFRGEVTNSMRMLRAGQKKGIRFDVNLRDTVGRPKTPAKKRKLRRRIPAEDFRSGHCCGCGEAFEEKYLGDESNPEPLISFPCSHAFHFTCFLCYNIASFSSPLSEPVSNNDDNAESENSDEDIPSYPAIDRASYELDHGIGIKVRYAESLRTKIGEHGCPLEMHKIANDDDNQ